MSDITSVDVAGDATRTRWGYIVLLIAAGVCASMQIGKAPPALPALQRDLGLGIVGAAWVISMFSVAASLLGFLTGSIADRFGPRPATVTGLLCIAVASALGATADGPAMLLASRALEGLAFVIIVVAAPSLIAASASVADRRFVPAMWGTYMPTGVALALVLSPPVLLSEGWRTLWELNAILPVLLAGALLVVPAPHLPRHRQPLLELAAVRRMLADRRALLLSLLLMFYAFQYLAILGFLPMILQQQGVAAQAAGNLTALVVVANVGGNLAASWLISRHAAPWLLMGVSSAVMGITTVGIFSPFLAPSPQYWLTVVFSGAGGLLPASVFATVPALARDGNSGATTMGLVVQASNIGQMAGPPAVAAVAAMTGGWQASPLVLTPAAVIAVLIAWLLRPAHAAAMQYRA